MNTPVEPVFDVTSENFEREVLQASVDTPILVDFWAPWCEPCKALGPILEKIAATAGGRLRLGKVNVDEQQELAGAFGIRSIPTVMLVKDGKPVDGFAGALPEGQIREFLARHMEATSLVEGEPEATDPHHVPTESAVQAIDRLRGEIKANPDNTGLQLDLAQALLQAGQPDAAQQQLAGLTEPTASEPRALALRNGLSMAKSLDGAPSLDELQQRVQARSDDWEARDLLGVRLLLGQDVKAGLEQFLYLLEHARHWSEGRAKERLLAAFAMIDDPALVSAYRRRMASLLF